MVDKFSDQPPAGSLDHPDHFTLVAATSLAPFHPYPFLDARGVRVVLEIPLGQEAPLGLVTWPKPGSCEASLIPKGDIAITWRLGNLRN